MRIPSKAAIEKIVRRHRKRKIRVSKQAAAEMYLFYLCYLRKLAKACDDLSMRQNKLVIGEDIIKECAPKLLTKLSMMQTMKTTLHPSLVKEMSDQLSENDDESDSDDELFSEEE